MSTEQHVSSNSEEDISAGPAGKSSLLEIFSVMGRLGCVAFGGPVAHLAHFQRELIAKRRWLSDEEYADLIAFCQFLPGPASSQVGMGIGLRRGGLLGMFTAWFAFTMPSVLVLVIAAIGFSWFAGSNNSWLHGLLAAVVAVVADAVFKMGKKLCPDAKRMSFALLATAAMVLVPTMWMQLGVIAGGALAGLLLLPKPEVSETESSESARLSRTTILCGWAILLAAVVLPIIGYRLSGNTDATLLNVYASFAQTGSLVFGGGHVVLPMLQAEVVGPGWMNDQQFLSGYGITQAMPGTDIYPQ